MLCSTSRAGKFPARRQRQRLNTGEKENLLVLTHCKTNIQRFNTRLLKVLMLSRIKGAILVISAYKLHHSVGFLFCFFFFAFIKASVYCNCLLKVISALCYGYRHVSSLCSGILSLPLACVFREIFILASS